MTVEQAVLEHSLAAIYKLVAAVVLQKGNTIPTTEDLLIRLQSLARESIRTAIQELRISDPLRLSARDQEQKTLQIQREEQRILAEAGLSSFDFETLVRLVAERTRSSREEERIFAQRTSAYAQALHTKLPALVAEMADAARNYQEAADRIADFFGTTEGLWDREPGSWKSIDWNDLDEAAQLVSQWPELKELAQRLGRKWSSAPQTKAMPLPVTHVVERYDELRENETGRSEIIGLTQGRNLALVTTNEIALLTDPEGELLFTKRYVEGTLSNLEYQTSVQARIEKSRTHSAPIPKQHQEDQGPVIICVDTSGSMTGMPERIAKALSLALVRACHDSGRACFLIAFSDKIACLDLTKPLSVLNELLEFMGHSFRGGTDLRPALYKSLELLDTPEWKNSDLLIISDFRVPKLMIKKANLIDPIRRRHEARLHALSIASHVPVDDLHIFDSHWHFRTGVHGEALGISRSQFKEM